VFSEESREQMSKKIREGSMAYWAAPAYPCLNLYYDAYPVTNLFENTLVGIRPSQDVKYYSIYADSEPTTAYLELLQLPSKKEKKHGIQ